MWAAKRLCSGGLVIPLVDPHLWPHPRSPPRRSSLLQTPCRRQFDDLGTAGRPVLRPVDGATALRVVVSGSEGWRASGGRPHLHHPPSHHHPQRRTGGCGSQRSGRQPTAPWRLRLGNEHPTRLRCRLSSHARTGRRAGRQSTYLAPFKTPSYAVAQPPCGGNCFPCTSQHPPEQP